jgi:hypothetical protein
MWLFLDHFRGAPHFMEWQGDRLHVHPRRAREPLAPPHNMFMLCKFHWQPGFIFGLPVACPTLPATVEFVSTSCIILNIWEL